MNLLVTGGAGYIGSIVAELALQAGHQVVVIDDLRAGSERAIPEGCHFVQGSLGDPAALESAFGVLPVEAVVHLAAEAAIEPSVTDPAIFFQVNVSDALALLEVMRRRGVRQMIFSSTAAVYGEPKSLPIDEGHPQEPINAYGASKKMFEGILEWYVRAYGFRAVTFRYFNAAGATEARGENRPHETHLLPLVIDAALGRRSDVAVFGQDYTTRDGTCIRDYVHVVDIARAHLLALEQRERFSNEVFNLGSEAGHTVKEIIAAVERVSERRVTRRPMPRRAGDPAVLLAAAARARAVLGWSPTHSDLDTIVRSAIAWRSRLKPEA